MRATLGLLLCLWPALLLGEGKKGPQEWNILSQAGIPGNADFYGGGDLLKVRLVEARRRVSAALDGIRKGVGLSTLCNPRECAGIDDETVCGVLRAQNETQLKECLSFLTSNAATLEKLNRDEATPLAVSPMPLVAGGASVNAMTELSEKGKIIFHEATVKLLSQPALVALMGHELGHKLTIDKKHITDTAPHGAFATGRSFLDTIGAALASYSALHVLPMQSATPIPSKLDRKAACGFGAKDSFALGAIVDLLGRLPTEKEWVSWRAELVQADKTGGLAQARASFAEKIAVVPDARGRIIRELFSKFLKRDSDKEEEKLMLDRIAEGASYDAIASSILGDPLYLSSRRQSTDAQFLQAVYRELYGRAPRPDEAQALTTKVGLSDRASLAQVIYHQSDEAWRKLAGEWYLKFLNRSATPAESAVLAARLKTGAPWDLVQASIVGDPEYAGLQRRRWEACAERSVSSGK